MILNRNSSSGQGSMARFGVRPHFVRTNSNFRGGRRL